MKKIIPLVFLFFAFCDCFAYDSEGTSYRTSDRIDKLERDITMLQKQLYRNQGASAAKASSSTANTSDIDSHMEELEEKLRSMTGQMEQLQHEITKQNELIEKLSKENDLRLSQLEKTEKKKIDTKKDAETSAEEKKPSNKKDTIVNEPTEEKSAPTESTKSEAQILFDKSFAYLSAGEFAKAEQGFNDFIAKYEDNKLIGNAYYWLGESYYAQKNYDYAAINFLRGYKKAPKGQKAAESLLKLSSSLSNMKKTKEACSALDKLSTISNLSNSIKKKMQEEIKKNSCK